MPIREQRMGGNYRAAIGPEQWRYPRYHYALEQGQLAESVLERAGVAPAHLRLSSWRQLNGWFGFELFDGNGRTPYNLELALTVYAALGTTPYRSGNDLVLHGQAHGHLQPGLTVTASVLSGGRDVKATTQIAAPPPGNARGLNAFEVRVPLDKLRFGPRDDVEAQLFHDALGALGPPVGAAYTYFRADTPDPLLAALALVEGGRRFADYLGDRSQPKRPEAPARFEAAVIWLLSLLRFRVIPLSVLREAEHLRQDGVEVGSIDILAHDAEFGLLLVDCTLAPPRPDKGDRLLDTARFVRGQIGLPARPVLVVPTTVPLSRTEWVRQGLAMVELPDLQTLHGLITGGNVGAASAHLQQLLDRVPHLNEV